ncbi:hypothetical protein GF326_02015 [Candidatus Bathyarchaeota archaeon]|nr:hypothetical protein [Candidatus Bathyarchaeota archaeon]
MIAGFSENTDYSPTKNREHDPDIHDVFDDKPSQGLFVSKEKWSSIKEKVEKEHPEGFTVIKTRISAPGSPPGWSTRTFIKRSGEPPRRLSPREYARVLGLPECHKLPSQPQRAYKLLLSTPMVPALEKTASTMANHLKTRVSRGSELETRVSMWLRRHHGFNTEQGVHVAGSPHMQT